MQDARIRIVCAAILSVGAFISIWGAVAVFLWWLVFTPRFRGIQSRKLILGMIALLGFVSILIVFSGGNGISYLARMIAILLIGTWLYSEQRNGDFLSVFSWAFGRRTGFEIGMIGESALQMAETLQEDFTRIQIAMQLKGHALGAKTIVTAGHILIHDSITRAEDCAELLSIRGYRCGGTICPKFNSDRKDIVGGICAALVLIFSLLPVSEFFILYH